MPSRLIWRLVLALTVGVAAALLYGLRPAERLASPLEPPRAGAQSPAVSAHPEWAGVGFRDADHLKEHFLKHGAEFGVASPEEYLRLAQQLRDRAPGPDLLEATRTDGTVTRFDRTTGGFIAFDRDGTIRTFFRPNDGEAYFRRQLIREPGRS
jgi:pyocin large subunit-like protein